MATITGINAIDSLIHGSWAANTGTPIALTYSFLTTAPITSQAKDAVGFAAMTDIQQTATRAAIASWASVANIDFTEVSSGGDIRIGTNAQDQQSASYSYYPYLGQPTYILTNNTMAYNFVFGDGDYSFDMLLHELGHTLGLKHPGDDKRDGVVSEGPFLPAEIENKDYSVMSIKGGASSHLNGNYDSTPMLYDIQAIQRLYGANMTYHTGADTYRFVPDSAPQCIWDAGGIDTLDFSACKAATIINLNAGGFSSTLSTAYNVSIAYNVTIERAIAGSGGSTIFGNDAGNVITGGAGSDIVHLGKGSDTVIGGGGSDTVVFNLALANYSFGGLKSSLIVNGEGTDLLNNISTLKFSDRSITLANYISLAGGGAGNDRFLAGTGNELFSGGDGLDTVNYGRARSNFTVSASDGDFTITDKSGSGGVDLVAGVERLKFADGSGVALDIDGVAGQTYRMYQAAFNRTPDLGGTGFWIDQMDKGLSLVKMAQYFLDSAESVNTFGALSDAQFVNLMYANVLHRAPDAAGLDFYLKGFAANAFERATVLWSFSESAENQAAVIGAITNGVNYTVY